MDKNTLQSDLRVKGRVTVDKITLEYAGEGNRITKGDLYIAHRKGHEPAILTARKTDITKDRFGNHSGLIYPKEKGLVYSTDECVRVIILEEKSNAC